MAKKKKKPKAGFSGKGGFCGCGEGFKRLCKTILKELDNRDRRANNG